MEYAISSTSLAHTFGNITSFATEYIKTLFPNNFFKTVHVSSTIAYRQMNNFRDGNMEFLKKTKPMLIIRPRVELTDQDVFLNGTYLTSRIIDRMFGDEDVNQLEPFINDPKNKYMVNYLLNRMKVMFDISVICETQIEQLNVANYFKNIVRQDRPYFLNTYLESHVPKAIFEGISKLVDIPIYDSNNNTKRFLEYLNDQSVTPVTYKLKNSSGNDEFFRFYNANIDTTISGLTIDDGSKRGFISDAYTISFSLSTEFYTSGLYYLFTHNKQIIDMISMSMRTNTGSGNEQIIPMFTMSNYNKEILCNGWRLYTSNIFKTESNKPDELDLKQVFTSSLQKFIRYHSIKGIPMETFLEIKVFKDSIELDPNLDHYKIDYNKMIMTTYISNIYSTYRILVYINNIYVNNLAKEVLELDETK